MYTLTLLISLTGILLPLLYRRTLGLLNYLELLILVAKNVINAPDLRLLLS